MQPGLAAQLPELTPDRRAIANRAESRRLAVSGDLQNLRVRCEEVMRWVNPPWDPMTQRQDPRPEAQSAYRAGRAKIHTDLVSQVVDRWASLQAGVPFIFRCKPPFIAPPIDNPNDPEATDENRKLYEIDRAEAQIHTSSIESQTTDWMLDNNFARTWLWANWSKEAFGKAIIKSGWDPDLQAPTAELYENPSTVAYGWSKRYGTRRLSWVSVFDQLDPSEVYRRFGIGIPVDASGYVDLGSWTGSIDNSDMDTRIEQSGALNRMVTVEEYWEWVPGGWNDDSDEDDTTVTPGYARFAFIIAGRVIEDHEYKFLKRLPFHVLENSHVPTYMHGKSTAESAISINSAYDDLLTRQHEVIEFESGPRYLGIGMKNADDVDIPAPFELLPLDDNQMVQQLDTRVDFFPSELHAKQLIEEALTRATGLTSIAWGMSPNAQTSGRAMSAEWRAVELPLTARLLNQGPEARELLMCWWDYAEAYSADARQIAKGDRRFEIIWVPFDIRDKTEKTLDLVQRLNAHLIDPETAIEESGYENGAEIMAKIRRYLLDPVWNPLNVQQYLTLQQLALTIRQTAMQVAQMEQQMGGQQPGTEGMPAGGPAGGPVDALAAQGVNAAGQAAQGATGPVTEANNQPGTAPGAGSGLPMDTGILMRTPMQGGIGNQTQVQLGGPGPAPAGGNVPQ
jgi:hypothetical protein